MKNYLPLIATQILNIDLYSLFRIKGKEINAHGNQTYYLGYDGLHSTKDEINIDTELLNKILTGKAEIIYLKDKKKISDDCTICDITISAVANRFKLGNLNLLEWRFVYYLIAKNSSKKEVQIIDFKEFEFIYHYFCNILTKEKILLESLVKKGILLDYKKIENNQIEIILSDNLLNNIKTTNYTYKIKDISNFKCTASYLFYDYLIYQLKKENFKIIKIDLNEFKKICSINDDSYSIYTNLKNKVIVPILKDINNYIDKHKYGLRIFFDTIKQNRKVEKLKFTVIRKEEQ